MSERPRVLFVGRMRYRLPLPGWLARKWDAVEEQLDYRILAAAEEGSPLRAERFRLAAPVRPRRLDGDPLLPSPTAARAQRDQRLPAGGDLRLRSVRRRRCACRKAARGDRTPVIVEVHGDWRTFARLYGSPARRLLARARRPLAAEYAVRRADATRAVSTFTARLVEEAAGVRRAPSSPPSAISRRSPSGRRRRCPHGRPSLSSGALEAYKNIDGLAAAWRLVAADRVPEARLVVVGRGSRKTCRRALCWRLSRPRRAITSWLEPEEVAAALDERDAARAPLVAGGTRPRRDRGVRARQGRGGDGCRRHSRSRH